MLGSILLGNLPRSKRQVVYLVKKAGGLKRPNLTE
jgi:hypothetical protein